MVWHDSRFVLRVVEDALIVPLDIDLETRIDQFLRGGRGECRATLELFLLAAQPECGLGHGGREECVVVARGVELEMWSMSFDWSRHSLTRA